MCTVWLCSVESIQQAELKKREEQIRELTEKLAKECEERKKAEEERDDLGKRLVSWFCVCVCVCVHVYMHGLVSNNGVCTIQTDTEEELGATKDHVSVPTHIPHPPTRTHNTTHPPTHTHTHTHTHSVTSSRVT